MRKLPEGFVYLRRVDPTIQECPRYASPFNFTGQIVPGYGAPTRGKLPHLCLREDAALALRRVQRDLKKYGLGLVVFDAFRPQKAVDFFKTWAKASLSPRDLQQKPFYYPEEEKATLFEKGYIAGRSQHSQGIAVDIGLIPLGRTVLLKPYARKDGFLFDGTLDMGGHFDLFSPLSWTNSPDLSKKQRERRERLLELMARYGLENYEKEWWHFSLIQGVPPDLPFLDFEF